MSTSPEVLLFALYYVLSEIFWLLQVARNFFDEFSLQAYTFIHSTVDQDDKLFVTGAYWRTCDVFSIVWYAISNKMQFRHQTTGTKISTLLESISLQSIYWIYWYSIPILYGFPIGHYLSHCTQMSFHRYNPRDVHFSIRGWNVRCPGFLIVTRRYDFSSFSSFLLSLILLFLLHAKKSSG